MRNSICAAAILAVGCIGPAAASDLPSRKEPPPPPPPTEYLRGSIWDGFYGGLNAGYGSGSGNASTRAIPVSDSFATNVASNFQQVCAGTCTSLSLPFYGATAMANTGVSKAQQGGFVGGVQVGFNKQLGTSFLVGVEADIQATGMRGRGGYIGSMNDSATAVTTAVGGTQMANAVARSASGAGAIRAGINWLGTIRGRAGWLASPTILLFGTGGLAYGGTLASTSHVYAESDSASMSAGGVTMFSTASSYPMTLGFGQVNAVRVGWTLGGGGEWMVAPNWSVKAEALYYSLGKATVGSTFVGPPVGNGLLVMNVPTTSIRYDGVVARAGVNYHFNSSAP